MDTFRLAIVASVDGAVGPMLKLSSAASSAVAGMDKMTSVMSRAEARGAAMGTALSKMTDKVSSAFTKATAKVTDYGKKSTDAFSKTSVVVAMSKKVDSVKASLESTARATSDFSRGFIGAAPGITTLTKLMGAATAKMEAYRSKATEASRVKTPGGGKVEKDGGGGMGGLLLGGVAAVGIGLVVGGIGKAVASAEEFQATARGLGNSFGLTGKDAKDFADQLDAMGDHSMMSNEQILDGFKSLAAAGLDARSATLAMAAAADVSVAVGAGEGANFQTAIGNMMKMGEVTTRTMMGLEKAGFSATELGSALGLGDNVKTFDELTKKADAAHLSVSKAASGLIAMSTQKFSKDGTAGGAAKAAAAASMSKQMENLTDNIVRLFNKIDFSPLINALGAVNAFFDDPAVSAFASTVKSSLGGLISGLVDGSKAVFAFFKELVGPDPMTKFAGLVKLFNALKPVVGILFSTLMAIAKTVAPPLLAAFDAIAGAVGGLIEMLTPLIEKFAKVAEMVAGGFAKGLGGAASLIKGITGKVFGEAPKAAEAVLEIHSPSRVFARIGAHTAAGFTQGVDAGSGNVAASVAGMANNAASAGQGDGMKGLGAGSAGGGNTISVSVQVDGAGGDAHEIGDAVAAKVRTELARIFGDMSLSQGSFA